MTLESYTCENCIWQKEETLYHLSGTVIRGTPNTPKHG
jgi:hypothetical protein